MNTKFVINDYVLSWYLLFHESISKELNDSKQKIWHNYQEEYNSLYNESDTLINDIINYIPTDDTVYNLLQDTTEYKEIYNNVFKYKQLLIKTFDQNKKILTKELKDIFRMDIKPYTVFLVDPRLSVCNIAKNNNSIVYGKLINKSFVETLLDIIYNILKHALSNYQEEYQEIIDAVFELCMQEFTRRINNDKNLANKDTFHTVLKSQIYPYFLMYLGVNKEDIINRMVEDNISFDTNSYKYKKKFKKMDLLSFIDFCITDQKDILNIETITI